MELLGSVLLQICLTHFEYHSNLILLQSTGFQFRYRFVLQSSMILVKMATFTLTTQLTNGSSRFAPC
jgi:hypothetical protein